MISLLLYTSYTATADVSDLSYNFNYSDRKTIYAGFIPIPGEVYAERNGDITGVISDYMQMVSNYANYRISFTPCSPERCLKMLNNNDIDLLLNVVKSQSNKDVVFSSRPVSRFSVRVSKYEKPFKKDNNEPLWYLGYKDTAVQREAIVKALSERGFVYNQTYSLIPYYKDEQLLTDYSKHKIDGIIVSNKLDLKELPFPTTIGTLDTFYGVRHGNEQLLHELENAEIQLLNDNPHYIESLRQNRFERAPLVLSEAEREYLRSNPIISVVASPSERPFSYEVDRTQLGIIRDIMKYLADELGVEFEYQHIDSYGEGLREVAKGNINLMADFFADFNWARINDVNISFPYAEVHYVGVKRANEELPEFPTIAALNNTYQSMQLKKNKDFKGDFAYYSSIDECLQAVVDGEADVTYLKEPVAIEFLTHKGYETLRSTGEIAYSLPLAIALASNNDPMLMSLLNKAIVHADRKEIESIFETRHFSKNQVNSSIFKRMFLENKQLGKLLTLIGCSFVLLLMLLYFIRRAMLVKKKWKLMYTDHETQLYNLNWFNRYAPKTIEKLKVSRKSSRLFIMAVAVKQLTLMRENYTQRILNHGLHDLLQKIRKENPWILETAVASAYSHFFFLCSLPKDKSYEEVVSNLTQTNSQVKFGNQFVHLDYVTGICPIPSEEKYVLRAVMDNAVAALNDANEHNQSLEVFNDDRKEVLLKQLKMMDTMNSALEKGEFEIWMQPVYNLKTHQTIGAEALVRWDSPELGFVMPADFIQLFESNSSVYNLDYYVLNAVCAFLRKRLDAGLPILPVSVNQSGTHLKEKAYLRRMKLIADNYNLPDNSVQIEIVENNALPPPNDEQAITDAKQIFKGLQDLKFNLAVSDLWSGYASMIMMQNSKIRTLKLNRVILHEAEKSARSEQVLRNLINFGHSLGMQVVCQGVEQKSQEELLLKLGCDLAQGFYYAKPMLLSDFERFLDSQRKSA
ncbi:MAG: EAL domain-containing protein [Succinivibrio sp.]|nr:EAL domain-containing protein [Succinivibrio sp.]